MKKRHVLVGIMLSLSASWASAGLMCDTRYTGDVQASTDCELGSTNNDSTIQVNLDTMFGFADWSQVWKSDSGGAMPGGLTTFNMDADLLGGTFDITWATPAAGDVMFVLKDGQDNPDTYVSWLLDPGDFGLESYTYTSPFLNTTSGNLKGISHASFYYRAGGPETRCTDCTNQVPVVGSWALMPLGLFGLALARRKNSKGS